jgi:hypothetical protein
MRLCRRPVGESWVDAGIAALGTDRGRCRLLGYLRRVSISLVIALPNAFPEE